MAGAFIGDTSVSAAVTWKPLVSQIQKQKGVNSLFNSSQIPGEILDSRWSATRCSRGPTARAALRQGADRRVVRGAGADGGDGPAGDKVLTAIAEGQQDTLASYKEQLSTTKMFYTPQERDRLRRLGGHEAEDGARAPVRLRARPAGDNTKSVDDVAIKYPDGTVQGEARSRASDLRPQLHAGLAARESCRRRCRRIRC
jgi:NitT/TauT family transport system substrate-binding protein